MNEKERKMARKKMDEQENMINREKYGETGEEKREGKTGKKKKDDIIKLLTNKHDEIT